MQYSQMKTDWQLWSQELPGQSGCGGEGRGIWDAGHGPDVLSLFPLRSQDDRAIKNTYKLKWLQLNVPKVIFMLKNKHIDVYR